MAPISTSRTHQKHGVLITIDADFWLFRLARSYCYYVRPVRTLHQKQRSAAQNKHYEPFKLPREVNTLLFRNTKIARPRLFNYEGIGLSGYQASEFRSLFGVLAIRIPPFFVGLSKEDEGPPTGSSSGQTQRTQYPSSKEYTLNYDRISTMI